MRVVKCRTASIAVAFLVACLAGETLVKAQDSANKSANDVERLVERMEQDWTTAEINKDMAAFDRLLADDWIQIDWEGKTDTKKQWLEFISSPDFKITSARIVEMKVRQFGNVALATGVNEEKSTIKGKDTSGRYAWTDTYANRNGHWQAIASQVTPVPSSEPSQSSAEKYIRESWVRNKEPLRGRFVWTDTWVLRNGKWQIVAAEDMVAEPK